MKLSIISFVIFLTAGIFARAQNTDRVITVNTDTILCKIKAPGMLSTGTFRYTPAGGKRSTKIRESEVREFYSTDRKLWYQKIVNNEGQPVFMRVLERGKICLYEVIVYATEGQVTDWYATKNSDTGIYIKTTGLPLVDGTKKGKKVFVTWLADNKPVGDQYIAENNPPIEEIKRLVRWYNTGDPAGVK
jgi:hypothetical protein